MPQPIANMHPPSDLLGIFCDIDDTLTVNGRLIPHVLPVMAEAQSRGLKVVPITGRPGGWVDHIARCWPVDGVVGENGGLWYWFDGHKLQRRFFQSDAERKANRKRLANLADTILEAVPGSALASDQPYRELDLAIDFREDVPELGPSSIAAIVREFEKAQATCKVSSIHVNGWYGAFDKLEGVRRFHHDRFGTAIDFDRWAFFGDSANDEPMFGAFKHSIGVANVTHFLPSMAEHPTWITNGEGGHGFLEGMNILLSD